MVVEQCINSAWYYLGTPCSFSHKLKLIFPLRKTLPNLKFPCYLRGTETFLRTATKMETPLTCLYFFFLIFFQYGLCTTCSHFLCMGNQSTHHSGFLRMNIESGSMENTADWLKAPTHRQFWVQKYTLSSPVSSSLVFLWENFSCILHTVFFFPVSSLWSQVTIIISVSLKLFMTSAITKWNICSLQSCHVLQGSTKAGI